MSTRRHLLTGLAASPLLGAAAWAAQGVLRVGDQKGGTQLVMKAGGVLDGLPYGLAWSQFAAAAPLLEALNAGAVDLAFAGDAPTTFAMAAGLQAQIIQPVRTTGAGTAMVVPATSPVREVADLRGRSIATNPRLHRARLGPGGRGSPGLASFGHQAREPAAQRRQDGAEHGRRGRMVLLGRARRAGAAGGWGADGGGGLLTGLSFLLASDDAIARRQDALLDFCRRLAVARRWADAHRDEYARVLAAEIGVSQPVARLTFETETPVPVPINAQVAADEQRTADRYLAAGIIRAGLDAARLFDASFNPALAGSGTLPG